MDLKNVVAISCRTNTGEMFEVPVREFFGLSTAQSNLGIGVIPKSDGKTFVASGVVEGSSGQLTFKNYKSENSFTGIPVGILAFDATGRIITVPFQQNQYPAKITTQEESSSSVQSTVNKLPIWTDNNGDLGDSDIIRDGESYSVGGTMPFWKWDVYQGSVNITQSSISDGFRLNGKLVVSYDPDSGELTIGNSVYTTTNVKFIKTDSISWNASGGGSITDVAAATAGNYTLTKPAKDGTYALLSDITDTAWLLDGNALSSIKSIGSTTNYNWNLIHNSNTIATVNSVGLKLNGNFPVLSLHGIQVGAIDTQLRNYIGGVSNAGFEIYDNTNSASRLTINASGVVSIGGSVGIGVASPSYKLDVVGTGHFSGLVTFDTVPSSLQDATSANHLVRYSQWIASTSVKYLPTAVKTVSLTNITLSGTQTVNGVALVATDRILVAGQTTASENGVYDVVSGGAWTRSTDSDTDAELRGFIINVSGGTYAGYKYINTNTSTITVGTTAITYSEFSNVAESDPIFTNWRDTTRTANTVWAAPNGSNGVASWRALVASDISEFGGGIVPIANGGTGSSTQNFVDLTTDQDIQGIKDFFDEIKVKNNQIHLTEDFLNRNGSSASYGVVSNKLGVGGLILDVTSTGGLYFRTNTTRKGLFDTNGLILSSSLGNSDVPTERLDVRGNIRYNTLLKPNNVAGTSGQFLGTNGTQDAWTTLTTSHISNLSSYTGFDARYFTETESDARFVSLAGSYSNPSWITSLVWSKLTGVPSTFTPSSHTLDSHSNVTITSNSSGEILKWNGTAWVNNTLSEAGIQSTLPSGTAGQFLIRNASAELEFFNLELEPTRLTKNKIAVGDSANYLSDYENFEFLESRFVSILKVDDSTKSVAFGMYGASSNSFISASGGSLTVRGDNGLIFSNFAGGGTLALTVDNDGKVGVTPLGTGGGSTPTLASTYIGYGSSGNALTGTSNFVYDAIKTAVYFNDSANYLYVGKSVSIGDMFEITAVGSRGIQLNTDMDIVIKNNNHLYLGSGADNKRIHIGRGATHDSTTHYLVINGEYFSFSMDNVSGWGDSNSASTPQVGDKVLFNVVDVAGQKRFVPQKINKKLFSTLTSGDTVLTL